MHKAHSISCLNSHLFGENGHDASAGIAQLGERQTEDLKIQMALLSPLPPPPCFFILFISATPHFIADSPSLIPWSELSLPSSPSVRCLSKFIDVIDALV
ncbi:hypothetical protein GOBAR_AA08570 [Gossypium barbadense]|uniref:Uncharacterized protein n=1 Tax=Gossypium barbadense TaxID=3634 RepID=A0A2P5Y997_GOSBA|nr:hypothetical protein GOBAR_AA08570 [Gossypium barbadense]